MSSMPAPDSDSVSDSPATETALPSVETATPQPAEAAVAAQVSIATEHEDDHATPTDAEQPDAAGAVEAAGAAPRSRGPEMNPAECAAALKQRFPALFSGAPKPLKLRIQLDIQERAPGIFTKNALSAFFRRHTGSTSYLIAVSKAPHRFDLDGQPAGEITAEHRQVALDELTRRRANQDARREQEDQQRQLEEQQSRNRATLLRDFERTTLTPANFCALKGVAVEELDGLLEIARREATERANQRPVFDPRGQRPPQDGQGHRPPQDARGPRPQQDGRGPRPPNEGRGPRPPQEGRGPRHTQDGRGPRPPQDGRGPRQPQDARNPRPPQEGRGPRPPRGPGAGPRPAQGVSSPPQPLDAAPAETEESNALPPSDTH